jgi:hypothetical protein
MDAKRFKEIELRCREIDAQLTAINETRVMPGIDPASYEDALLNEQDALQFELGIGHFSHPQQHS